MKVALVPFFSQQDKQHRKFRLDSDSGVRLYAHIADSMRQKLGWDAALYLPQEHQCVGEAPNVAIRRVPYELCIDNLDRRLQWEPSFLRKLGEMDLVLTQHEFFPYPLRCLCPNLRIVVECGIRPTTAYAETAEMFKLSYEAADAVHFNSRTLADEWAFRRRWVWRFAYEDSAAVPRGLPRDVDVLFNARASATNYSNHVAFLAAFGSSELRIAVTDPTSYLRAKTPGSVLPRLPREEYVDLLHRSKVVVSLTDNGYGGYAWIEAAAAGAVPVVLNRPEYHEVLGDDWPYYCELNTVRAVTERALRNIPRVARLPSCSYSGAWKVAKRNLLELMA